MIRLSDGQVVEDQRLREVLDRPAEPRELKSAHSRAAATVIEPGR
jgi:hypothetical protein